MNTDFFGKTILRLLLFAGLFVGGAPGAFAQFTFMGDYDKTFNTPKGYYVDPLEPDPTVSTFQTHFYTGEYAPDGSIIAGGRHVSTAVTGDFYIRKFTASGAVAASFGTNGLLRTNFHSRFDGVPGNDTPQVLKVQPDGKILFAGQCTTLEPNAQTAAFGVDACVMRYNADGTLDNSFGGITLVYTYQGNDPVHATTIEPGKFIFQTGIVSNGQSFGTQGTFYDIAIQPDGKIVLVGETRNFSSFFGAQGYGAIVVRLNANGSLDSSFGAGGIARWTAPEGPASCFPPRRFLGVRVQPDGRIVAVGFDSTTTCGGSSASGNRFVVTRWTAAGQLETVRHLDNNTAFNFQDERAAAVHLTRDATKILVSGSFRNLSGAPAGRQKPTLVRLNVSDLSLDTSFGTGGIAQYSVATNGSADGTFSIKAIQPDGRIIGSDNANVANSSGVVRLNPDGSPDNSFGNLSIDGSGFGLGRLRVSVEYAPGSSSFLESNPHLLARPNGRINLLGYVGAFNGIRAVVSQQNTTLRNGIYADFENDGKDNLAVYRASEGIWHNLDSRNNNYSAAQWGVSTDKIAPADYDGDGRADRAVFRDGTWYILLSSNGQARIESFGLAGDLPRPGDFDGDGLADISVFRPSSGTWYRLNSSNGTFGAIRFGADGDVPMLGDYDADGKTDFAVFRPSNAVWYILRSSDFQVQADVFGINGDIPLNGDFNGDSKSDLAVFRPSDRTWYIARPTGVPGQNFDATRFGLSTDVPVAADYDNDGKTDIAVYRNGSWWILRSGTNDIINNQFGVSSDKPVPAAYLP